MYGRQGISEAAQNKIYWVEQGSDKVRCANLDGSNVRDLVTTGLESPFDITLDMSGGTVYWTDWGTSKIQRANLNGTNIETLVSVSGPNAPEVIALNIDNGKMYWTEWWGDKIQRANLNGTNIETLVSSSSALSGIVLDIQGNKMYWADLGAGKIQRANLNGTNIETLISGLGGPAGIALDIQGNKMYWTDFQTDKIQRANLNGTNIETLISGLSVPLDIALDIQGNKMYWTDSGTGKIQRANLNGTSIETLISGLDWPSGIALDVSGSTPLSNRRPDPPTNPVVTTTPLIEAKDLNLDGHIGDVRCVAYSPWGVVLASGGTDDYMRLWRSSNGQALATYKHDGDVNSIAFSPDDAWIASGSDDGNVRLYKWNTAADTWVASQSIPIDGRALDNNVRSVTFNSDGTVLACGTSGNKVMLWKKQRNETWQYLDTLTGHRGGVNSIAFSPNDTWIASASDSSWNPLVPDADKQTLIVWQQQGETWKYHQTLSGDSEHFRVQSGDVNSVAFSSDGTAIVSGGNDETVILWKLSGNVWRYNHSISPYNGNVNSVAYSPRDNTVAIGCDDRNVLLWNIDSGAILPLEGHTAKVRSVAFNAGGNALASGSDDGKVRQWQVPSFSGTYGLDIPDNMIWQPAQSANASYFFFGAKVSTVTGVPLGADIENKACKITLNLPANAYYFILPVTTSTGKKIKAGGKIATATVNILALGPGLVGKAAGVAGATIATVEAWQSTVEAFTDDLQLKLPGKLLDSPEDSMPFIIMTIPQMDLVSVTVQQEFRIDHGPSQTVTASRTWDISDDVPGAPTAQPTALADWPPFQWLSPESQQLLLQLSEFVGPRSIFSVRKCRGVADSRGDISAL